MTARGEDTSSGRRRMTSRGDGADMRIVLVRWNGFTPGSVRLFVRLHPTAALRTAVGHLRSAGFAAGDDTFPRKLRDARSEWLAQDLRLGEVRRSWKRGIVEYLADGTGLEFLRRFWRGATPTLIVACARTHDERRHGTGDLSARIDDRRIGPEGHEPVDATSIGGARRGVRPNRRARLPRDHSEHQERRITGIAGGRARDARLALSRAADGSRPRPRGLARAAAVRPRTSRHVSSGRVGALL